MEHQEDVICAKVWLKPGSEARHALRLAAHAMAVAAKSAHAIDAYHQAFKRETWVKVERLEIVLDLVQDRQPGAALPSPDPFSRGWRG